jgi:hypothetical protein
LPNIQQELEHEYQKKCIHFESGPLAV